MEQDRVGPEDIAAFLDNRLESGARAEVIRRLLASRDSYDLFVETVRELHPQSPEGHAAEWARDEALIASAMAGGRRPRPDILPFHRRVVRHARKYKVQYALAASVAALLIVTPRLVNKILRPDEFPTSFALVSPYTTPGSAEPGHVTWPGVRGSSRTPGDAAVFRIGVRLVDLQVALRRDDPARSGEYLGEIVSLLENIELTQLLRAQYAALQDSVTATGAPEALAPLAVRAEQTLTASLDQPYLRYGKWAEAGRVAAANQSVDFFRTTQAASVLDSLQTAGLSDSVGAGLESMSERVAAGTVDSQTFDLIESTLAAVIAELGR